MTPLLELVDVHREHRLAGGAAVRAVDGVSFELAAGETLALVGESGCGKSTLGRCVAGLSPPTSGEIRFHGEQIPAHSRRALRPFRRRIRMVFQDHGASVNPRRRIRAALAAPLRVHGLPHDEDALRQVMAMVDLRPELLDRYPHELSGGQRQRIGVARAIAVRPELVVLDEAVSALDVSVQAQICNLLKDLQEELGVSYLFISHDLGVVRQVADRIAVMYLGRIVEMGTPEQLYTAPSHPYTEALLSAVPIPDVDAERRSRIVLEGEVSSAIDPPAGCRFHPRCRYATDVCRATSPELAPTGEARLAACHHPRAFQQRD